MPTTCWRIIHEKTYLCVNALCHKFDGLGQTANRDPRLPTMNCAMCPITVKKALTKVDGVSRAEVSYEDKEAMVTFDDEKTSADALIEATTNAGFPSTIKNKAN